MVNSTPPIAKAVVLMDFASNGRNASNIAAAIGIKINALNIIEIPASIRILKLKP